MRYIAVLTCILIASGSACGQIGNCRDFRTGVFQFSGINGGVYTIIRTDSTQLERSSNEAGHFKMKIAWEGDCTYILSDRIEYLRGKESGSNDGIKVRNEVYKFEKPDKFYVKTFAPGFPDTVETIFVKLDTTKYYTNLFQLAGFAEFKNSGSYGQTLLGEIHSIDYYESNRVPGKYLIVFETTYHGELLNKTRLIDSAIVHLREGEGIANKNCRFNGAYDDEIVAIYHSDHEEKEARILRAFRCNRRTEKLEEVDAKKVRYKEADRMKVRW